MSLGWQVVTRGSRLSRGWRYFAWRARYSYIAITRVSSIDLSFFSFYSTHFLAVLEKVVVFVKKCIIASSIILRSRIRSKLY